ncbi:MAG: EAL domain-containing protein [Gammaproteobacteria bacterium]|nr:EAL domain-containing protein [Gammaproteobacteria bacterium]
MNSGSAKPNRLVGVLVAASMLGIVVLALETSNWLSSWNIRIYELMTDLDTPLVTNNPSGLFSQPAQLFTSVVLVLSMGFSIGWSTTRGLRIAPAAFACLPLVFAPLWYLITSQWFQPLASFLVLSCVWILWQRRRPKTTLPSGTTENHHALSTLKMLAEAVLSINEDGRIRYLNPAAESLTGWKAKDAIGEACDRVFRAVDESQRTSFSYRLHRADIGGLPRYWVLTRRDRSECIVRASFACLDEPKSDRGMVITFSDVTHERRLAEQIRYQASHDSLTDLPNRMLLQDRLVQAMARAQRSGSTIAILYTDLDDFKKYNDSMGHSFGDQLLRAIADRLREVIRAVDTVARVGGDEFVVLVEQLSDEQQALSIAEKLASSARELVLISGQEVFVTLSIGVSFFPQHGTTNADLLKNADVAMYRAKAEGGDQIVLFKPEMNEQVFNRFTLENDLQRASVKHEFRLLYQPFVDLSTGLIVGTEALIRWQHPSRGLLGPQEFIPLAERNGFIVPLGEWVIRTACIDLARWYQKYDGELRIAVNLSPRQLKDARLPTVVEEALRESGLPPECLELEITEEVFMANTNTTVSVLRRLMLMGIKIAIDDFGTGYSSLSYLKRLPITRLKIDRSFIKDIKAIDNEPAIVQAIIAMARNLHLQITAEGVETAEQVAFLQHHGYIESQGFYGKPVSASEIQWLLQYTNTPRKRFPG